ncbi:substance-K receptor-like [Saccoglossus kowalevskii]|uniref:Substance-K receptor-like n=1 Tax=Saccoglossus kowalevskii TaxID=10224 RepID=A0ABM0MNB9_SACKO|nr:PREDICTED: substance-K receptor-like [Saccoglossus kowalevskii]
MDYNDSWTSYSYEYDFWTWKDAPVYLTVIYYFVAITSVVGNVLVLIIFSRIKRLRTLTNYFLLHQSLVDLLSTLAFSFQYLSPKFYIDPTSISAILFCRLYWSEFFIWTPVTVSSFNLVALSLERFFGIVHPVVHRNKFSRGKLWMVFLAEWLIAAIYMSYWIVLSVQEDDYCITSMENPVTSRVMLFFDTMVQTIVPLGVMAFAYIKIWIALKAKVSPDDPLNTISSHPHDANRTAKWDKARKNVVKTLCIVFITFLVCWFPMTVYNILYTCGMPLTFGDNFYLVAVVFSLCNMCVNPIIYSIQYKQFKKGITRLFCKKKNEGEITIGDPTQTS